VGLSLFFVSNNLEASALAVKGEIEASYGFKVSDSQAVEIVRFVNGTDLKPLEVVNDDKTITHYFYRIENEVVSFYTFDGDKYIPLNYKGVSEDEVIETSDTMHG
jgi:hypothetical protein